MTRNLTISYLRVTAMLMVVFYHCLCIYTPMWSNPEPNEVYTSLATFLNYIDMSLFVFISGYLYSQGVSKGKYDDDKAFVINKSKRLLVPFAFWGAFSFLLLGYKFESLYSGIGHLWFLIMLFAVFMIFHSTRRYWLRLDKAKSMCLLVFLLLVNVATYKLSDVHLFLLQKTLFYLLAFYLGTIVNKCKNGRGVKIWIVVAVITLALCSLNILPGIIVKILIPTAAGLLCVSLFNVLNSLKLPSSALLLSLDKYSMGIYLIHHVIIRTFVKQSTIQEYILNNLWTPVVIFPILLILSYYITKVINKTRIGQYAGL